MYFNMYMYFTGTCLISDMNFIFFFIVNIYYQNQSYVSNKIGSNKLP